MTSTYDRPLPRLRTSEAEENEQQADDWLIKAAEAVQAGNPGTATVNALMALAYGVRGVSARLAESEIPDAISDVGTAIEGLTETTDRVMVAQDLDDLVDLTAMMAERRRPFWRRWRRPVTLVQMPDEAAELSETGRTDAR